MADFDEKKVTSPSQAKYAPELTESGKVPAAIASIEKKTLKKEELSSPSWKGSDSSATTTSGIENSADIEPCADIEPSVTTSSAAIKIDSLAASKYRQGDYKGAAEDLRRALNIREEFLGPDDIDLLNNVNNLAAALGRLKRYDEAEALFRRVLKGREDKLGPDHVDTLATVNHLGVVVKQQRKLPESEQLLLRALTGLQQLESALSSHALLYAEAAYNFAVLCVQLGKRHKAARYFGIAHQRLEKSLGKENPHTMDSLHWQLKCMKYKPESSVVGGEDRSTTADPAATGEPALPGTEPGVAAADAEEQDPLVGKEDDDEDKEVFVTKNSWKNANNCELCSCPFTLTVRPHHCRVCARCVCDHCSKGKTVVKEFGLSTPVRCCYLCEQQGF